MEWWQTRMNKLFPDLPNNLNRNPRALLVVLQDANRQSFPVFYMLPSNILCWPGILYQTGPLVPCWRRCLHPMTSLERWPLRSCLRAVQLTRCRCWLHRAKPKGPKRGTGCKRFNGIRKSCHWECCWEWWWCWWWWWSWWWWWWKWGSGWWWWWLMMMMMMMMIARCESMHMDRTFPWWKKSPARSATSILA